MMLPLSSNWRHHTTLYVSYKQHQSRNQCQLLNQNQYPHQSQCQLLNQNQYPHQSQSQCQLLSQSQCRNLRQSQCQNPHLVQEDVVR
ncbi:hypothetical protein ATCV1_z003L [Acanthocystis turfacea chlorella virus 1]|uniref:Uncharacterized protein z003L n=1 Tax=Chlorovirus heliozoae TaxID=322019 RepID=A7K7W3_9PHYC|nr:hypothetical protein ATCV1_z003L [Acanthocystis turfacea chlorella virus 1]ABT16137.1 hypothetical protein ATCV1_z003L [Acanthocystis turfacea chlorella virus 1]